MLATRYGEGAGLLHLRFGAKWVLFVTSPVVAEECFTVHVVALADRPWLTRAAAADPRLPRHHHVQLRPAVALAPATRHGACALRPPLGLHGGRALVRCA